MDLSRVIIFTPDVTRLSEFYRTHFGLSVVGEPDEDWVELRAGGCNLAFHRFDDRGGGRNGWIKLVFGTKDVAEEKARLESLGLTMSDVVRFGSIELCDGHDPDGNWIQISSRGV